VAFSAAGKRVLITGASSGVGAALALALAKDGAVVCLIARRRDRLAEVLTDCLGGRLGIIHESAYCASKFALCGWSESMAVDLHGTGISVKLIEPGPVDTEIWDQPGNDDPIYDGPKFSPEEVAQGILEALGRDGFEHYVPEMKAVVDLENADIDTYIAGAVGMARP